MRFFLILTILFIVISCSPVRTKEEIKNDLYRSGLDINLDLKIEGFSEKKSSEEKKIDYTLIIPISDTSNIIKAFKNHTDFIGHIVDFNSALDSLANCCAKLTLAAEENNRLLLFKLDSINGTENSYCVIYDNKLLKLQYSLIERKKINADEAK